MIIHAVLFLVATSVASAGILLVRRPLVLADASPEDCAFVTEVIGLVALRHGLKDRTFIAPDHRIFVMFAPTGGTGRVAARREGTGVIVSFDFDARAREVCDSVRGSVREALVGRFGARIEEPDGSPKQPNQSPQRNAGSGPATSDSASPPRPAMSSEKTARPQSPRG